MELADLNQNWWFSASEKVAAFPMSEFMKNANPAIPMLLSRNPKDR